MSDIVERWGLIAAGDDGQALIAANAEITRLRAENERLRAALEEIASGKYSGLVLPSLPPRDPAVNRARAALEERS